MENKSLIERHTMGDGDSKKVNAISAFQEIDVRLKTLHLQVQELQEALMGAATLMKELEERVNKVAPKIDIVSMDQAKKILSK
jgi:hypothetical protein